MQAKSCCSKMIDSNDVFYFSGALYYVFSVESSVKLHELDVRIGLGQARHNSAVVVLSMDKNGDGAYEI